MRFYKGFDFIWIPYPKKSVPRGQFGIPESNIAPWTGQRIPAELCLVLRQLLGAIVECDPLGGFISEPKLCRLLHPARCSVSAREQRTPLCVLAEMVRLFVASAGAALTASYFCGWAYRTTNNCLCAFLALFLFFFSRQRIILQWHSTR
jgi:hypothetical protein